MFKNIEQGRRKSADVRRKRYAEHALFPSPGFLVKPVGRNGTPLTVAFQAHSGPRNTHSRKVWETNAMTEMRNSSGSNFRTVARKCTSTKIFLTCSSTGSGAVAYAFFTEGKNLAGYQRSYGKTPSSSSFLHTIREVHFRENKSALVIRVSSSSKSQPFRRAKKEQERALHIAFNKTTCRVRVEVIEPSRVRFVSFSGLVQELHRSYSTFSPMHSKVRKMLRRMCPDSPL